MLVRLSQDPLDLCSSFLRVMQRLFCVRLFLQRAMAEASEAVPKNFEEALCEVERQKKRAEKAEAEVQRLQLAYDMYCAACQGTIEDEKNCRVLHCFDQHKIHKECEAALMSAGQFSCPACHEQQAL